MLGRGLVASHVARNGFCTISRRPLAAHHHHTRNVSTMALQYPAPIICTPANPTAAVIFLHGLGDTGHGWSEVASQFQESLTHVKFVFPTAPRRPITLNWGMAMPGWYDIVSLDGINQKEDEEGLKESMRYIEGLIAEQVAAGIPSNRIAVGGFSQGGAVALLMLRSKTPLGAIIGLSTYLPLSNEATLISDENKNTPILMCHGDVDQVVNYQYGQQSHEKLSNAGAKVEFVTYNGMGHSASPQELLRVQNFLLKNLPVL